MCYECDNTEEGARLRQVYRDAQSHALSLSEGKHSQETLHQAGEAVESARQAYTEFHDKLITDRMREAVNNGAKLTIFTCPRK
jgi:hypothetical protein